MKTDASNGLKLRCPKWLLISFALLFAACTETYQPKPHGHFRIGLPEQMYKPLETDCPYSFQKNDAAIWIPKKNCWGDLRYPSIKSNVQLTYKALENENDLKNVLEEAQNLAYKHTVKAQGIAERQFENRETNVYGLLYSMQGNAASSTQFFVTDSTNHFLRGVVYFYSVPNSDSLQPVNNFMMEELVHLMETLEWKN